MPFPSERLGQTLDASATQRPLSPNSRRNYTQRERTTTKQCFSNNNSKSPGKKRSGRENSEEAKSDGYLARPSRLEIIRHWSSEAHQKTKSFARKLSGIDRALEAQAQREENRDLIRASIRHANSQIDPNAHTIAFAMFYQQEFESRYPMQAPPSVRQDNGRNAGVVASAREVEVPTRDLSGNTFVSDSGRYIELVPW